MMEEAGTKETVGAKDTVAESTERKDFISDRTLAPSSDRGRALGQRTQELRGNLEVIFGNLIQLYKLWVINEGGEKHQLALNNSKRDVEIQLKNFVSFLKIIWEYPAKVYDKELLIKARELDCAALVAECGAGVEFQQKIVGNLTKAQEVLTDLLVMAVSQSDQASMREKVDILVCLLQEAGHLFHPLDLKLANRLIRYDVFRLRAEGERGQLSRSKLELEQSASKLQTRHFIPDTFPVEAMRFGKMLERRTLVGIENNRHADYLISASVAYSMVVPLRIGFFVLDEGKRETGEVRAGDYFAQEEEEFKELPKALLHYFQPKTKNLVSYNVEAPWNYPTKQKEAVTVLNINFNFGENCKSVVTQDGEVFVFSPKSRKFDTSFYQLDKEKLCLRKKADLPEGREHYEVHYFNRKIFLVGGESQSEKCPRHGFCYSIDARTWRTIAEMNVGVRFCTLTSLGTRYLFKIGGLNEFDYIDKSIECYDVEKDGWVMVKIESSSDSIEFMEKAFAVPIQPNNYLVFGGKNMNGFRQNSGFIFEVEEFRQRKKMPSRVSARLHPLSAKKSSLLCSLGELQPGYSVLHRDSAYFVRTKFI